MRALVIEDEARLARNIAEMLEQHASFAVDVAADGPSGLRRAMAVPYDLLILDLRLPELGGLELLRQLRAAGSRTPVLVITALDDTNDVVQGLDLGADDYLTKPFHMAELCARARALVRRSYDRPDPVLTVGRIRIDTSTRQVSCDGRTEHLPAMEYRMLEYLALRAGEVVSKTELVERLYDFNSDRLSNVVEVYVSSLRRRFGAAAIRTVRGHGYMLTGDGP
jgi:DNA-binding response OmpR family regulator